MPTICPKDWLKAKQLWIYAILLMSVEYMGWELLRTVCVKYICLKLAWKPNMMDMYVKFMSVGPVGPGGGIYTIIEDIVCKVHYKAC